MLQLDEDGEIEVTVGDKVSFELSNFDYTYPRWIFNDDTGSSDIWVDGTVVYADDSVIQVEYSLSGTTHLCTWPNYNHEDYDSLQWFQEGYLNFFNEEKELDCECGSAITYGSVQVPHSTWCPCYTKER